jgi:SAM-dependent methyltransferase
MTPIFNKIVLEQHLFPIKMIRLFTVPILNSVPSKYLQKLIKKSSPYGSQVIERPGTTHALESMYTKHENRSKKLLLHIADLFWHNITSQPKAIRNRLKIVEYLLEEELRRIINLDEPIKIYNLGGGSSRAVIKIVAKYAFDKQISVTTIDKDSTAIEIGKLNANKSNIESLFSWVCEDVRNIDKLFPPNSGDLVEMVGLLDYFNNESSVKLINKVYNILKPGGLFIVANVYPNNEQDFVNNIGWPKMYYKNDEDMKYILTRAGFSLLSTDLYFEPLMVHIISSARK